MGSVRGEGVYVGRQCTWEVYVGSVRGEAVYVGRECTWGGSVRGEGVYVGSVRGEAVYVGRECTWGGSVRGEGVGGRNSIPQQASECHFNNSASWHSIVLIPTLANVSTLPCVCGGGSPGIV